MNQLSPEGLHEEHLPVIARLIALELDEPIAQLIDESREAVRDPARLLEVQLKIAAYILSVEEQRRGLRAQATNAPEDESVREEILMATRITEMLRDVGDGVAWRAFGYRREIIRDLAAKAQTGGLDLTSTCREFDKAEDLLIQEGGTAVVHCVTNCLRYGDFTLMGGDGKLIIREVKTKKSAQGSRAKRQRRSLVRKLASLESGLATGLPGYQADMLTIPVDAKSDLAGVDQLIRDANKSGFSQARLSDSLFVVVARPELLGNGSSIGVDNPFTESPCAAP
ncbi:MAG: hypothetical protein WEC75_00325 [Dehalococcoidia bacterium]